jgi:hypothetical protein
MSRPQLLWVLDRIPRYVSLLGLLGLLGLAGLVDPAWYCLSALSFLSYLAFFRFFRRFIDPTYGPTTQSTLMLLPAFLWLCSTHGCFQLRRGSALLVALDGVRSTTLLPLRPVDH